MAGRIYTLNRQAVAVTAVQDLMSVLAGTMAFKVHEVVISQTGQTTVGNLNMSLKRLTGTLTAGSGGAAVTPAKHNNGDAAATVTGRGNDTTQASSTATTVVRAETFNPINGYQYLPPPDDQPVFAPGQQFVLSLDTPPAASEAVSVSVVIEELF